ncbi:MAG: hypothetical protein IJV18_12500, partial [Acidaminococcaceae bacterium]|nr:hypothetical protein [Acidaminococcaceae bacterium]
WTNSENTLLVGEQPIMSFDGVADSGSVETRLRDILSNSKAAKMEEEKKAEKANVKTAKKEKKVKTSDKEHTEETKPLTMRQKVEAYYAGQK